MLGAGVRATPAWRCCAPARARARDAAPVASRVGAGWRWWSQSRSPPRFALPLDVLNAILVTEPLGIGVVDLGAKGRGVVALEALSSSAAIPAGEPLAHSGGAPFSLPAGPSDDEEELSRRGRYETIFRKAVAALERAEPESDRRHPRLVTQIATRVALEDETSSVFVLALASLCSARMSAVPEPWKEDAERVRAAMRRATDDSGESIDLAFLSDAWYAGVVSRIHLNAMRADAAGASTALFALASFFNHSRDPNLLIEYVQGHVTFRTSRPIRPGEELTIDYHHDRDPETRRAFLLEHYGFDEDH